MPTVQEHRTKVLKAQKNMDEQIDKMDKTEYTNRADFQRDLSIMIEFSQKYVDVLGDIVEDDEWRIA